MKTDKDWKSQYKAVIQELESKEAEWRDVEAILRKTVGRLSIAGRGIDDQLDKHLKVIQTLSRDRQDQKLGEALEKLADVVAALDDKPQTTAASNPAAATDPSALLLELLQTINFKDEQRAELKSICSDLLSALVKDKSITSIKPQIAKLAALINQNIDTEPQVDGVHTVLRQLLALLALNEENRRQIDDSLVATELFNQKELNALANIINRQLATPAIENPETASVHEVLTTLLERLTVVQGGGQSASLLQSGVLDDIDDSQWPDTLDKIVDSIAELLKKLNAEKLELENFIVNVTQQLGQISEVIVADQQDHAQEYDDRSLLQDLMLRSVNTIKHDVDSASDILQLKQVVDQNLDLIRSGVESFVQRANQRQQSIESRNRALREKVSAMTDETQQLQVKLEENRKKLLFDSLTGIGSRLAYDEQLERELARFQRHASGFSYAILDIDFFKKINDVYGHSAGDKALQIVAKMMQSQIRKSDALFRIGGEEFVLLLPNTSLSNAEPVVQNLREKVSSSSIHCKQQRVLLTLSAGITEAKIDDTTHSLYQRADAALYRAKHAGRNCQMLA